MDPIVDPKFLASLSPQQIDELWIGPAADPPLGETSNFANPHGDHVIGYFVVILSAVLVTFSVVARFTSRWLMKSIDVEDGLLLAAFGLHAGLLYAMYDLAIWPGYRVHEWDVRLSYMPHFLFHTHIASIFYGLTIMLLKVAILLTWLRLFTPARQRNAMFWISHLLIWSNVLFYGIGTIVEIFQCTPREKIWNPVYQGGSCRTNMAQHMVASLVINWVSDVAILILPQRVIWKLNVSKGHKVGLSLLFAVGLFACICATVRIVYMIRFQETDPLYAGSELVLWMAAELTAGFLILGLPSFPKVFKQISGSESVISLLKSITVSRLSSSRGKQENSRAGLLSWYKPLSRKRVRKDTLDELDLDTHDLVSVSDGAKRTSAALVSVEPMPNEKNYKTARVDMVRTI